MARELEVWARKFKIVAASPLSAKNSPPTI